MTEADLAAPLEQRARYTAAMDAFFERHDLLVTPTMPCPPFRAGADQPGWVAGRPTEYLSWTAFTYPFNVTGQPAASVPCGRDSDGLPVGLQIVGRRGAGRAGAAGGAGLRAGVSVVVRRPGSGIERGRMSRTLA